ncbi:hypothetical protein B0A52_04208 [Exophiala mesophila]|uniref:Uncharacterized protein n=1 Tax=Exophiala mesophila TaxID=212818 RepID=A0A438N841_EXOME|nr:hypothetical protein B0A52_04208 [Exophiala mesophila]
MPPLPARNPSPGPGADVYQTAFSRAHPTWQKLLVTSMKLSTPLLITATLFAAGLMKRPLWERVFMWRAALVSFLSRWVLVTWTIAWTLNGWEPPNQQLDHQHDEE